MKPPLKLDRWPNSSGTYVWWLKISSFGAAWPKLNSDNSWKAKNKFLPIFQNSQLKAPCPCFALHTTRLYK